MPSPQTPSGSVAPGSRDTRNDDLIAACQRGERIAFDEFYRVFESDLRAWIARHIGPSDRVEDLAQETFIRVFARIGTFRIGAPIWPWLTTVARHVCADSFRSEAGHPTISLDAMDADRWETDRRTHASAHDQTEVRIRLKQEMAALTVDDRRALWLQAIEDQSYEDIARRHRQTVDAARNRAWRAKRLLQSALGDLRSLWPPALGWRMRARVRRMFWRARFCDESGALLVQRVAGIALGVGVLPLWLFAGQTPVPASAAPRVAGRATNPVTRPVHLSSPRHRTVAYLDGPHAGIVRASASEERDRSSALPRRARLRIELTNPKGGVLYVHQVDHECARPASSLPSQAPIHEYC